MGNCGGFMEALRIVGQILVFAYNSYALKSTLAENLVRFVPKSSKINYLYDNANKLNRRQEEYR